MELLFASHNPHKTKEISLLLPSSISIKSLADYNLFDDIEESGTTLEANALLKARFAFNKTHQNSFADDTGLEVESLKGAPGVYSARYAGEDGNSEANIRKLLRELEGVKNRKAQFRCCVALIFAGQEYLFEGIIKGEIIYEKRGIHGFGYDSVFIPAGYTQTFAELPISIKNTISHRTLAIKQMTDFLSKNINILE
jgi:XTP/dITP diphosphohydrolase